METPSFVDEPVVDPNTMTDRELLIRMDGRLSTGFTSLFQSHSTLVDLGRDHESRIRALERVRWYLAGIAAVVAVIGTRMLETVYPIH